MYQNRAGTETGDKGKQKRERDVTFALELKCERSYHEIGAGSILLW